MWPRNDGISPSSTRSVGEERGFTNWPAIRPTLTTGNVAPYVSTAAICSMIFSFSRMGVAQRARREPARRLARVDSPPRSISPVPVLRDRMEPSVRIFSGIQPTGAKTFGNYAGGFRQYAETQEHGDAFFCIVDLHS